MLPTLLLLLISATQALALEPIPDKLVVLTFDDSSKSHVTVAAPLLKKHGFGATFFVTEGFDSRTNKRDYMTWDEIARLHRDGFEIGNHTRDHKAPSAKDPKGTRQQFEAINAECLAHGIPRPVSFAYPGNALDKDVLPILHDLGIKFGRRGGAPEYPYDKGQGFAYEPGRDHPLLIPSAGDARPGWTLDDFKRAVSQAKDGKIAVIQLHGVPDTAHSWVNTPQPLFESYLKYLADNGYRVIALRDLVRYVDPTVVPTNPWGVIEDRQRRMKGPSSPIGTSRLADPSVQSCANRTPRTNLDPCATAPKELHTPQARYESGRLGSIPGSERSVAPEAISPRAPPPLQDELAQLGGPAHIWHRLGYNAPEQRHRADGRNLMAECEYQCAAALIRERRRSPSRVGLDRDKRRIQILGDLASGSDHTVGDRPHRASTRHQRVAAPGRIRCGSAHVRPGKHRHSSGVSQTVVVRLRQRSGSSSPPIRPDKPRLPSLPRA